jgi:hypothetical protein
MGEKKVVNRNIAFALGLMCIVLAASTVGIAVYSGSTNNNAASTDHTDAEYSALVTQLEAANQNISSLTDQILQLQSELANNNTQTMDLHTRIDALTSQLIATNSSMQTLQDYYNSLMYVINTENHDMKIELSTANARIASLQSQIAELGNLTTSTVWVNQTVSQQAGAYTTWSESASYAGYVSIQVSSSTSNTYANVTYSSHGVSYNTQTNIGVNGTAYFPVLPASNIKVTVGNTLTTGTATENVTVTYYY